MYPDLSSGLVAERQRDLRAAGGRARLAGLARCCPSALRRRLSALSVRLRTPAACSC
jgi:hypothetical protein